MNTTFMANNNICIGTEHRQLPSFYWLPKLQRNVVLNACLNYLLFASRKSQTISNNIVEVYTHTQESSHRSKKTLVSVAYIA